MGPADQVDQCGVRDGVHEGQDDGDQRSDPARGESDPGPHPCGRPVQCGTDEHGDDERRGRRPEGARSAVVEHDRHPHPGGRPGEAAEHRHDDQLAGVVEGASSEPDDRRGREHHHGAPQQVPRRAGQRVETEESLVARGEPVEREQAQEDGPQGLGRRPETSARDHGGDTTRDGRRRQQHQGAAEDAHRTPVDGDEDGAGHEEGEGTERQEDRAHRDGRARRRRRDRVDRRDGRGRAGRGWAGGRWCWGRRCCRGWLRHRHGRHRSGRCGDGRRDRLRPAGAAGSLEVAVDPQELVPQPSRLGGAQVETAARADPRTVESRPAVGAHGRIGVGHGDTLPVQVVLGQPRRPPRGSVDAVEDGHALHVVRHREERERPQRTEAVPVLGERGDVAGERRRVAGHVDDSAGAEGRDGRHGLARAGARRVEDDDVDGEMLETYGGLLAFAEAKAIES